MLPTDRKVVGIAKTLKRFKSDCMQFSARIASIRTLLVNSPCDGNMKAMQELVNLMKLTEHRFEICEKLALIHSRRSHVYVWPLFDKLGDEFLEVRERIQSLYRLTFLQKRLNEIQNIIAVRRLEYCELKALSNLLNSYGLLVRNTSQSVIHLWDELRLQTESLLGAAAAAAKGSPRMLCNVIYAIKNSPLYRFGVVDGAAMLRDFSMFIESLCDQRRSVQCFPYVMDEANFSSCLRNLFSTGDLDDVCLADLGAVGPAVDLDAVCLAGLDVVGPVVDLDAVCLAGPDVVGPVVDLEVEPTGGGYRGDEFVCLDKSLCACSTKFPAVCCKYIYLPNKNSARFGDYGSFSQDSEIEFDFCLVYDRGKEAERS